MKLNKRQHQIYDLLISTLAVLSVIFILLDYSDDLLGWQRMLYRIFWGVFVADYLARLITARKKKKFFFTNFYDLIALLPFHGIFPFPAGASFALPGLTAAASIALADHALRLLNLTRIIAFLCRPLKKANRFFNTNGFKYVIFVSLLLVLSGGVLIHYAEGMSVEDGIWWAFVTATTVGYGDISPHTFYGKLIAMVLMLLGIGLLGSVTSTLTSFFLERRGRQSVKDQTLEMIKEQLDQFDDLTPEDVEALCQLLRTMKKHSKNG